MFDRNEQSAQFTTVLYMGLLVLIAAAYRLYNLNGLGYSHDESIQALAVKGILDRGYPVFDSGAVYVRSLLLQYIEALSAKLFGWNEGAIRLPSALFNVATIPLVYFFTRDLIGRRTALVAVTLFTFSAWEVELSRAARMYTAFQFFYLMSLYAFFKGFIQRHRVFRYVTLGIFFLTFTTHQLSFTLSLLFLFPFFLPNSSSLKRWQGCLYFLTSSALYMFFWQSVRSIPHSSSAVPKNELATTQHIKMLEMPSLPVFEQWIQSSLLIAGLSITLAGSGLALLLAMRRSTTPGFLAFGILILAACCFQQIGIAAIVLFFYILWRKNLAVIMHRSTLLLVGLIGISFISWYGYATYAPQWHLAGEPAISTARRAISVLIDYPRLYDMHVALLLKGWLGFAIWSFVGLAFLLIRYLREQKPHLLYLTCMSYLVPIIAQGFFAHQAPRSRYFFHIYPILIIFFSFASVWLAQFVIRNIMHLRSHRSERPIGILWPVVVAVVFGMIISRDFGVLDPLEITRRTYTFNNRTTVKSLNQTRPFEIDYRTCCLEVQPHIRPDDILICFGSPITRYPYTQRVDYFVKRNAKSRAPKYMSNGIPTLERLHEVLRKEAGNRVWIFGDDCASLPNWYTFEMCQFLEKLKPNAICTDLGPQQAAVYLLDQNNLTWADDPLAHQDEPSNSPN